MSGVRNFTDERKNNGAPALPRPHAPVPGAPLPISPYTKRPLLFSREIWAVEKRPGFAFSSLYGRGT